MMALLRSIGPPSSTRISSASSALADRVELGLEFLRRLRRWRPRATSSLSVFRSAIFCSRSLSGSSLAANRVGLADDLLRGLGVVPKFAVGHLGLETRPVEFLARAGQRNLRSCARRVSRLLTSGRGIVAMTELNQSVGDFNRGDRLRSGSALPAPFKITQCGGSFCDDGQGQAAQRKMAEAQEAQNPPRKRGVFDPCRVCVRA